MKLARCFLIGLPLAVVAVGPLVYTASFILQIGLGMAGVPALGNPAVAAWFLAGLLRAGARVGLIAGLAAAVSRCRPKESAALAGGLGLAFRALETVYLAAMGRIVPGYFGLAVAEALMDSLAILTAGYLTAVLAACWDRRWPQPEAEAPKPRPVDYRFRL